MLNLVFYFFAKITNVQNQIKQMDKITKFQKIISVLFIAFFSIWLGGSAIRSIIAYSVFEPSATQTMVRNASNDILMQSVYLYSATNVYTFPAYLIAFVSALILLFQFKHILKNEGWLFMSFVLFFLFSPVQLYNGFLDIKLSIAIFWEHTWEFYSKPIQDLFLKRILNVAVSSFNGLSFLANLTILVLIVWQPLKKTINNE